jgi:hypothetical protein
MQKVHTFQPGTCTTLSRKCTHSRNSHHAITHDEWYRLNRMRRAEFGICPHWKPIMLRGQWRSELFGYGTMMFGAIWLSKSHLSWASRLSTLEDNDCLWLGVRSNSKDYDGKKTKSRSGQINKILWRNQIESKMQEPV